MRASEKGKQRASPPVRVSTRRPPSSGISCTEQGEGCEHRGERAHPQRVGRVRNDDRPRPRPAGLREAPQPLPLPPDDRLQPQALAPLRLHVAELDGAALDHDVARQSDVQGEEGAGHAADQRAAADQSGPPDLSEIEPARGRR